MNMNQKVLTKIFESLLNTAAQAPTDDIVNRDGISLMKQGFDLIMQAHREGGATGPIPKELIDAFLGVRMPQKPVTIATLSEQLTRIEAKLAPIRVMDINPAVQLDAGSIPNEEVALAVRRALHRHSGLRPIHIALELTTGASTEELFYRDLHQLSVKWGHHLNITPPLHKRADF